MWHQPMYRGVSKIGRWVVRERQKSINRSRALPVPKRNDCGLHNRLMRIFQSCQQCIDRLFKEGPILPAKLTQDIATDCTLERIGAREQREARLKLLEAAAVMHCGKRARGVSLSLCPDIGGDYLGCRARVLREAVVRAPASGTRDGGFPIFLRISGTRFSRHDIAPHCLPQSSVQSSRTIENLLQSYGD